MKRIMTITEDNKPYVVRRYTDYITSRMDSLEVLDEFKDYFFKEKINYPVDTLQSEINKFCPEVLEDHIVESVVGKGSEFSHKVRQTI